MPSEELEQLMIDNNWSKYAKIKLPKEIKMFFIQLNIFLGLIAIAIFAPMPVSLIFYIFSIPFIYFLTFSVCQIYYYHKLIGNPNYQECKFSKMLYGGK